MLLAGLAQHKPRDIQSRAFLILALSLVLGPCVFLLKQGNEQTTVGRILFIHGLFFFGEIVLPNLVFRGNQCFSELVIHAALIRKIGVLTANALLAFLGIYTQTQLARLYKESLCIRSDADRLLSDDGSQPPERFVPGFIFLSLPVLFSHCSSLIFLWTGFPTVRASQSGTRSQYFAYSASFLGSSSSKASASGASPSAASAPSAASSSIS